MKAIATLALAIGAASMLAGCQRQPAPPRTAHFFETHAAERASVLTQCRTGDRTYQPAEECASAAQAEQAIAMRKDAGGV